MSDWQVASWGGYTFIINLLPIHCLACVFTGQLSSKLYVGFAPLILIGTIEAGTWHCSRPSPHVAIVSQHLLGSHLLTAVAATPDSHPPQACLHGPALPAEPACVLHAASIPVIGFNAVLTSEHFGSFLALGILHGALAIQYIKVGRGTPACRHRQLACMLASSCSCCRRTQIALTASAV